MPKAVSIFIFLVLGTACMIDLEPALPDGPDSAADLDTVDPGDTAPIEVPAGEPVARALRAPGTPLAHGQVVADRSQPGDAHAPDRRHGF